MRKRYCIFPVVIVCAIIFNGCNAKPDEPPATAIDFSTASNTVNWPSIFATSGSLSATTYPATTTSSQSLFPSTENSFQSTNTFPKGINTDSTIPIPPLESDGFPPIASTRSVSSSFSSLPDFASSIANPYLSSATSSSDISLPSLNSGTSSAASLTSVQPASTTSSLNPFAKAALSLPSLQKYLDLQISGIEAAIIFYLVGHRILVNYDYPTPEFLADEISQAAAKIQTLTLPIYFQAVGNTFQDFFNLKGMEVTPLLLVTYSTMLDYHVASSDIHNAESLYRAFTDALANFLIAVGFHIEKEADTMAHLLSSELKAFAKQ